MRDEHQLIVEGARRFEEEHRAKVLASLPAPDSGLSLGEVLALGDLIQVDYAWCPEHGRVTPEILEFPFTITSEALEFVGVLCAGRGCEGEVYLHARAAVETRTQHVLLIEDEYGKRPAIDVKPAGGRARTGVALPESLR